jgi:hypothetical protein
VPVRTAVPLPVSASARDRAAAPACVPGPDRAAVRVPVDAPVSDAAPDRAPVPDVVPVPGTAPARDAAPHRQLPLSPPRTAR